MATNSRLDTALNENDATEWYRSPLALVAGIVLFLGVLAVIVMLATGGDDGTATQDDPTVDASADTADTGDSDDTGDMGAAADGAADTEDSSEVALPAVGYGGDGIPEVDEVTVVGESLPTLENPADDAAVGMVAPQFTATSLASGRPVTIEPGRARIIGFFAHWCPHCQRELPVVSEWLAENTLPPNTEFIAVSTAVDEGNGNYPPSEWFNEQGFTAPVVVDDASGSLLHAMGLTGFPAFVAVDASGVVVARASGNIGAEGLEALVGLFAAEASQ